jgi:nicotinamide phosphoribosyltransferase
MGLENLILATDSYKLGHWNQYPKDTEAVYSYLESREGAKYPYTVFFGLQYILKRYLTGFTLPNTQDLVEAQKLAQKHFGAPVFNYKGWSHVITEHNGQLPLRIKAVPEGTPVPTGNVMMTVENTCPDCYWLTNAMESILTHVWYSSTVATQSRAVKEMMKSYLNETGQDGGLQFMLHDFGYRGATSHEAAAIGGAGHLVNFVGTDTLPAMILARDYYGADLNTLAFSVPATEHSVMTARGKEGEFEVVDQLLDEYPEGILSVVSDSYDIYEFVKTLGEKYKDRIMARDGKLVVRPDSGDPILTTMMVSELLWDAFGGTTNEKGYRVLDPHVGILWGDGIDPAGIQAILKEAKYSGFAAENYVFGMGGGLLQKVNRDTQRFAFKCSAQKRDGEWHDVYKDPTDKSKVSKKGRLQLIRPGVTLETKPPDWEPPALMTQEEDLRFEHQNVLQTVYEDGKLLNSITFDRVRENARL